jgi:hypothetical protein
MWFLEQIPLYFVTESVIVMDNARYHSVLLEKSATISSKKLILQLGCPADIFHTLPHTHSELLQMVRIYRPHSEKYGQMTLQEVALTE